MTYYEGKVVYKTKLDYESNPPSEEREITKPFFQTTADLIMEEPPNQIEVRSIVTTPKNFNSKANRKYLRRKNQVW